MIVIGIVIQAHQWRAFDSVEIMIHEALMYNVSYSVNHYKLEINVMLPVLVAHKKDDGDCNDNQSSLEQLNAI